MSLFEGSGERLWPRLIKDKKINLPLAQLAPKTPAKAGRSDDPRYRLTPLRTFAHSATNILPPYWRDAAAEWCLRREGAPGPASEHAVQYRLSVMGPGSGPRSEIATVAKGADLFYERQYRQHLNATMGVFAMTAKLALLGCGGHPRGMLWGRRRPVQAAMMEEADGAAPIIVLDHQTVAVPVLLPKPANAEEKAAVDHWLSGARPMPPAYRRLAIGDEIQCATPYAKAWRRTAAGSIIEVIDGVRGGGKLAILALHPCDPDAMGLHITLFATEALTADAVEHDYALDPDTLYSWRRAAWRRNCLLRFCVGGVEEAFTQCSQNLFVKRPVTRSNHGGIVKPRNQWRPSQPLDHLLSKQFELLQITVSASGLPGVSPRNGEIGKAAFVVRRDSKALVLIPYFAGNAVHGHAAKLWSNPQGSIVVWDDHTTLSTVTIRGPCRVVEHGQIAEEFRLIADRIATRQRRNGSPAPAPEYWFEQKVAEIILQDGPLAANALDPARPTSSIHAAGRASHGKKPTYFLADTLPPYDQAWQHEREAEGRPSDPSGVSRRYWEWECAPVLAERLARLRGECGH